MTVGPVAFPSWRSGAGSFRDPCAEPCTRFAAPSGRSLDGRSEGAGALGKRYVRRATHRKTNCGLAGLLRAFGLSRPPTLSGHKVS
jgi:hypothetical protein